MRDLSMLQGSKSTPGILVLTLAFLAAVIVGGITAISGWLGLILSIGALALLAIMIDYRVGAVILVGVAPLTSENVVGKVFLILACVTLISLALKKFARRESFVSFPAVFLICYGVPYAVAVSIGLFHIGEAFSAAIHDPITR